MPLDTTGIFTNIVPEKDYLDLRTNRGEPRYKRVMDFLQFRTRDVAKATGIPLASIRFDNRVPRDLRQRMSEWSVLINLVAQFFSGDKHKTSLWFTMPNPLLGNIAPRDMIRFGRYKKLLRFITSALSQNQP